MSAFYFEGGEGMDNGQFLEICKKEVAKYANDHLDKTDNKQITEDDVYVVWACKTLQNNKALLSMKQLFISQPMKGKTDKEILAERETAIKEAEAALKEPVEVIDSFFQNAPVDAKPLWFLGKSIELLSTADIAYFASGWENARGCKIEHECAKEYGIQIMEQEED